MATSRWYFSHDHNAQDDIKLVKLRMMYGWEGYGLYWGLIERMRSEESNSFALEYGEDELEARAYQMQTEVDLMSFVDDCIDIGLFEQDEDLFYSPSLRRRMGQMDDRIEARREAGRKAGRASGEARRASRRRTATKKNEPERTLNEPERTLNEPERTRTGVERSEQKQTKLKQTKLNQTSSSSREVTLEESKSLTFSEPDAAAAATETEDVRESSFGPVIQAYEELISPTPSRRVIEDMQSWVTESGIEPGVIVRCIEEADDKGARNFAYIKAIVGHLIQDGITTLEGLEARERDFQRRKERAANRQRSQGNAASIDPDAAYSQMQEEEYRKAKGLGIVDPLNMTDLEIEAWFKRVHVDTLRPEGGVIDEPA